MTVVAEFENVELEYYSKGDANVIGVELLYPRNEGAINTVELGLSDVRAADSIRITYDFERDGWAIQQASTFEWGSDQEPDMDWQEVAFVQAWAREVNRDD